MQVENVEQPPPEILNVAKFLRAHLKNRGGVLNGRRVDYFKGKSARKALLSDAYKHKSRPSVESKEDAEQVLLKCIIHGLFLAVNKGEDKTLTILKNQGWGEDFYYVWLYEGSQLKHVLGGLGLVLLVMAGVMFPLWPAILRNGVWYLSVGVLCLLGLFFLLAIVRLIFYVITVVVARPGIWIFPNLFEDVGIVESFIPLWAWDAPTPPKIKKSVRSESTVEIEDEQAGDWDTVEADDKDVEEKKED